MPSLTSPALTSREVLERRNVLVDGKDAKFRVLTEIPVSHTSDIR
ncbi:MAG: hypothetical protein AAGE59_22735 [Cyanobacteria bacterium P01_F01_bin.86]